MVMLYGAILGSVLFLNIPVWVMGLMFTAFITIHAIKTA